MSFLGVAHTLHLHPQVRMWSASQVGSCQHRTPNVTSFEGLLTHAHTVYAETMYSRSSKPLSNRWHFAVEQDVEQDNTQLCTTQDSLIHRPQTHSWQLCRGMRVARPPGTNNTAWGSTRRLPASCSAGSCRQQGGTTGAAGSCRKVPGAAQHMCTYSTADTQAVSRAAEKGTATTDGHGSLKQHPCCQMQFQTDVQTYGLVCAETTACTKSSV